jgi:chemotaxis protein methyltransferase CheR
MEKVSDYYGLMLRDKEELKLMLDSVTTNLTRFFRNQPHLTHSSTTFIPEVLKLKKASGDSKIRIWSAGCSTGEEPYTLAMISRINSRWHHRGNRGFDCRSNR